MSLPALGKSWVTCNLSQLTADINFPMAIGPNLGAVMRAQSLNMKDSESIRPGKGGVDAHAVITGTKARTALRCRLEKG